jgi:polyisoprenoid-binding protein YceI
VLGFFALGDSLPVIAARAIYAQSSANLSSIWWDASPQQPYVRPLIRPEKFVVIPSESRVTYHTTESFLSLNRTTEVVGGTSAIRSEIVIDRADIRNTQLGPIAVDISSFVSNSVHRDNAIRARWLESSRYPVAEFTPAEIRGLPTTYAEGRTIPLEVIGTLKIHDVARPARFAMNIRLRGNTLTGRATSTIHMTDFGVRPPSIGIVRVSDQVTINLRFTARRVDLDVSARKASSRRPSPGRNHSITAIEREERLRSEAQILREGREILKIAAGVFAKEASSPP